VHPNAIMYSGAVALNGWTSTVRARVKKGTEWSALNEAVFVRSSGPPPIRIVEIMFAPAGPNGAEFAAGFTDKDEFEYFELQNVGTENVNLRDIRFTQGLDVTFVDAILAPGERGVVVRNRAAFQMRYGTGPRILGEYVGALNDGGERLAFVSALGVTITDFSYNDDWPWPAGLTGQSLILRNPALDPSNPASWRPSVTALGNPGAADATTYAAWKAANGVSSDSTDLDKDGLLPIEEYATGGSPTTNDAARNPAAGRATFTGPAVGDYLLMSFVWKRGTDDLTAVIEHSTDLATWTAAPAEQVSSEPLPDGTDRLTFKTLPITSGTPKVFLRLRWTHTP
jgi:hypothetical protein